MVAFPLHPIVYWQQMPTLYFQDCEDNLISVFIAILCPSEPMNRLRSWDQDEPKRRSSAMDTQRPAGSSMWGSSR